MNESIVGERAPLEADVRPAGSALWSLFLGLGLLPLGVPQAWSEILFRSSSDLHPPCFWFLSSPNPWLSWTVLRLSFFSCHSYKSASNPLGIRYFIGNSLRKTEEGQTYAMMEKSQRRPTSRGLRAAIPRGDSKVGCPLSLPPPLLSRLLHHSLPLLQHLGGSPRDGSGCPGVEGSSESTGAVGVSQMMIHISGNFG